MLPEGPQAGEHWPCDRRACMRRANRTLRQRQALGVLLQADQGFRSGQKLQPLYIFYLVFHLSQLFSEFPHVQVELVGLAWQHFPQPPYAGVPRWLCLLQPPCIKIRLAEKALICRQGQRMNLHVMVCDGRLQKAEVATFVTFVPHGVQRGELHPGSGGVRPSHLSQLPTILHDPLWWHHDSAAQGRYFGRSWRNNPYILRLGKERLRSSLSPGRRAEAKVAVEFVEGGPLMRTEPWIALPVLAAEELRKRSIRRGGNVGDSLPGPLLILAGASVVSCTSGPAQHLVTPLLHKLLGLLPICIGQNQALQGRSWQVAGVGLLQGLP